MIECTNLNLQFGHDNIQLAMHLVIRGWQPESWRAPTESNSTISERRRSNQDSMLYLPTRLICPLRPSDERQELPARAGLRSTQQQLVLNPWAYTKIRLSSPRYGSGPAVSCPSCRNEAHHAKITGRPEVLSLSEMGLCASLSTA
jgi:hypothetical protein